MGIFSIKIYVVVTDVVNGIAYSRKSVITHEVIRFLGHDPLENSNVIIMIKPNNKILMCYGMFCNKVKCESETEKFKLE